MIPPADQHLDLDVLLDRCRFECVVDYRPEFTLRRVDFEREIIHYSDVNEFFRMLDDVQNRIYVVCSAYWRERWRRALRNY